MPAPNLRCGWLVFALLSLMSTGLAAQTPPVTMRIETENSRTIFRIGETIGIKATLETSAPGTWRVNASGRDRPEIAMGFDRFVVSPLTGTSDPQSYRFGRGFTGGGLGGWSLSDKPFVLTVDLNQWLRFERPGFYRVRAVFHATATQPGNRQLGSLEFESNDIGIEIYNGDAGWMTSQLQTDAALLDSTHGLTGEARMDAARRIWYLDTPESLGVAARLLGSDTPQVSHLLQTALLGTQHPDQAIAAMQALFTGPDQAISPAFLDTLAELRKVPTTQLRRELAAVVEKKRGQAKAISLKTLLDSMLPDNITGNLRSEIALLFPQLPAYQQAELLGPQWNQIAGPAMIPVLRQLYDQISPDVDQAPPLVATGVEKLYALDPTQARLLILEEMRRALPRLPFRTLAMLPDVTLPEMDQTFAAHLERLRTGISQALIARYATASILGRVKAGHTSPSCEPALVAYLLRVEPVTGDAELRTLLADRVNPHSVCWFMILPQTAVYYSGPAWEKVAVEALDDGSVTVKTGVVRALAQYGSSAAAEPVWKAFTYWHDWWKSRPAAMNEENRRFEQAFLEAFIHPKNWPATDFARVRDLCITDDCKARAGEYQRNKN